MGACFLPFALTSVLVKSFYWNHFSAVHWSFDNQANPHLPLRICGMMTVSYILVTWVIFKLQLLLWEIFPIEAIVKNTINEELAVIQTWRLISFYTRDEDIYELFY